MRSGAPLATLSTPVLVAVADALREGKDVAA